MVFNDAMLKFSNTISCDLSKFKPSQTNLAVNPLIYIKGIKDLGAKITINHLSH
jgi:hypothetical protein